MAYDIKMGKFKTRKEIRKEKRAEKKLKRNSLHRGRNVPTACALGNDRDEKSTLLKNQKKVVKNSPVPESYYHDKIMLIRKKETMERKKYDKGTKRERVKFLKAANVEEDKMIKHLEKRLKMDRRKSKSLPEAFVVQGLDYLLEVCDDLENHSKFKKDSALVSNLIHCENSPADVDKNDAAPVKTGKWEDIYGRTRDEKGAILESTKYIPPHIRNELHDSFKEKSEAIQKLSRRLKGLLNKLVEHNMHSIVKQIEDAYMSNSRSDVNTIVLDLLNESIVSKVLCPERIVVDKAALISLLHANVGSEIGAFFLQHFVERFDKCYESATDVFDKVIDNILLFIVHLYNFKVFHCCLLYDILGRLTDRFCEKDVDLILLILRNVGFCMRKDDPAALKDFITAIQKKATQEMFEDGRTKFMLDTLLAIKNNNVSKLQQYDPSYVEHLKKITKSMLRKGCYVSELKITLHDILNVEIRGRWWIVGSAWTGSSSLIKNDHGEQAFEQEILQLAKKQRMNTDVRRNIFCILMTAQDYCDAFEKLTKLELRGRQFQEIVNVILHCLLRENKYNPYYALVAEKFCTYDRKYALAVQFALWDKFKNLPHNDDAIANMAKFILHLLKADKLSLSLLKVVEFAEISKREVRFIRQILLGVLTDCNEEVTVRVFSRVAKSVKGTAHSLRDGLHLFLRHFILKNAKKAKDGAILTFLRERVKVAEQCLLAGTHF